MLTSGPLFETVWHWLIAYGIALGRPLALISLNPLFTRAQVGGLLRGAVATALALPMVPRLAAELAPALQNPVGLLLLSLKEAAIGAALGLLLGAPFWALDVAGDVLDAQRGATQGRLNDPAGFEDVSITGTLLMMTGIALFVLTGGLEMLADLLYGSWRPPRRPRPPPPPSTCPRWPRCRRWARRPRSSCLASSTASRGKDCCSPSRRCLRCSWPTRRCW